MRTANLKLFKKENEVHDMKTGKWIAVTGMTVFLFLASGCQTVSNQQADVNGADTAANTDGADTAANTDGADAAQDSENLNYDGADLEGDVAGFTDEGFSLAPAENKREGEGMVMEQPVIASVDESDLVEVSYGESCEFEVICLDLASQKEVSREPAGKEEIKKETQVLVFGTCEDTRHWTARKVAIMRWQ